MNNLSQKEKILLQDQKSHEEICVQKYQAYAKQARDPHLRQIFTAHAQQENQHLQTINQIISGQMPSMGGYAGMGQQAAPQAFYQSATEMSAMSGQPDQGDAALCRDMLMTEKYVSGAYNMAIFEFAEPTIRQALNHIQADEQQHGEDIFNFMQSHGLYNY